MNIAQGFADHERGAVAALYWQAFGGKLGRTLGPRAKALRFLTRALQPTHAICARDGQGRLLGVAGFKTMDGALVDGGWRDMAAVYGWVGTLWRVALLAALERDVENRRFLMDGICVDPAAQGRGVGTRLLEAVAQEARARGYAEMRLDVIDTNPRARALYERRGFRAVDEQKMGWLGMVFGFQSSTVMVRALR